MSIKIKIKKEIKWRIESKYSYVAIPKSNKIYIVPSSSDNGLKISKKKGFNRTYSLIDIRNKKVRKVTGKADKLIGLIKYFIPNPQS